MQVKQVIVYLNDVEHFRVELHSGLTLAHMERLIEQVKQTWDVGAEESAINSQGLCIFLFTRAQTNSLQMGA
jgi:hypothetical protein